MYLVNIDFMDGTSEQFYAITDFRCDYSELRVVYWVLESGDKVSYPVNNIRRFKEIKVD